MSDTTTRSGEVPADAARDGADSASLVIAALPVAVAVGVFGVIFGAAGSLEFGPLPALAMSLLVFSGSAQFAVLGLAASGAGALAMVAATIALDARHLVLGATLRPRVAGGRVRRAILGWFLIDESFGLAMSTRVEAGLALLITGGLLWAAWQLGTLLGVAGASVVALEGLATAIFPVLFTGLAAITAGGRDGAMRAAVAAIGVAAASLAIPALQPYLPIVVAVLVALPGGRAR